MPTSTLAWFARFLFAPAWFTRSYYPLFVHRVPKALFALHALFSLGEG